MTSSQNAASLASNRVLVTGGSGFIGSPLCTALASRGAEVHSASRTRREHGACTRWQVDLSDLSATRTVVKRIQPSLIFHLASHVSGSTDLSAVQQTLRNNLITTANMLTAASEVGRPRVVVAGSMEEGDSHEQSPPVSPYAAAKSAATIYTQLFSALYELPVVNLRVFMAYGPGQHDTTKLIPYVTTSLLRGDQPSLSSGRRQVDWVFVDDVVAAFLAAAVAEAAPGHTIDVGSGELVTVRSVVDRLGQLIGGSVTPLFGALKDRPHEHRRVANLSRAWDLLAWRPTTSLDAGLERTVAWFRRTSPHDSARAER